jgi:hypothetical protein
MPQMQEPWWRTEHYFDHTPLPRELEKRSGPEGVALVKAFKSGATSNGWGQDKFMANYHGRKFWAQPILNGYLTGRWMFAVVMRSVQLVCIDIDGKNGGYDGAKRLGMLPYTLAETSKSGEGMHLFYSVSDDLWDPELGFGAYSDRIGIEQGVDIRGVGCVYHYPQQLWNDREIKELPPHLKDRLLKKADDVVTQTATIIKTLTEGDETEVLMMQDSLVADLNKPIPAGRRNTTLFAIGQQMKAAQVPGWEKLIFDQAVLVGLDVAEANKIVANVKKYNP